MTNPCTKALSLLKIAITATCLTSSYLWSSPEFNIIHGYNDGKDKSADKHEKIRFSEEENKDNFISRSFSTESTTRSLSALKYSYLPNNNLRVQIRTIGGTYTTTDLTRLTLYPHDMDASEFSQHLENVSILELPSSIVPHFLRATPLVPIEEGLSGSWRTELTDRYSNRFILMGYGSQRCLINENVYENRPGYRFQVRWSIPDELYHQASTWLYPHPESIDLDALLCTISDNATSQHSNNNGNTRESYNDNSQHYAESEERPMRRQWSDTHPDSVSFATYNAWQQSPRLDLSQLPLEENCEVAATSEDESSNEDEHEETDSDDTLCESDCSVVEAPPALAQ